jgi:hypothetical protein
MTSLTFPSEDFPAQPAITLQIPDDWQPVPLLGAVMAARRTGEQSGFVPNIVVRTERRAADFELTEALVELKAYAGEHQQGVTSEPFKVELDGRLFIGCDLSWVDEQAGTVLQAHLFGGVASGPFFQLVQVTGSVGGAQGQVEYPTIKAIMKSLKVSAPEHGASAA